MQGLGLRVRGHKKLCWGRQHMRHNALGLLSLGNGWLGAQQELVYSYMIQLRFVVAVGVFKKL